MADLITASEYKASQGITGTELDARLNALIPAASLAIKNYTGRNIGDTLVSGSRTYEYDGSGFVEIDDASALTSVVVSGSTLASNAWTAEPYAGPVFTWIAFTPGLLGAPTISPQMGFESNLDQLWPWLTQPPRVVVSGTFGWPTIPTDVKQAAIWTVESWLSERPGNDISGESIAAYSVQYAFQQPGLDQDAIPARAQALLNPYRREQQI